MNNTVHNVNTVSTVSTVEGFLELVADRLGLPVTAADADRDLDQIPGWDSLHLLWLVTVLEKQTGRPVRMADLLQARTLGEIHAAAVTA